MMNDKQMISFEHIDAKGRPIGECFDARARRAVDVAAGTTRSWGRALVESDGFRKDIATLAGRRLDHQVGIVVHKARPDEIKSIFELTSGALVGRDRQFDNPAPLPRRVPRVRDLLFPGSTGASVVEFLTQTVRTNAAAPVIEGAVTPPSDVQYGIGVAPVGFIGTLITVSRQLFDDSEQVVAAVDGELSYALQYAEDYQLLYGVGATGFVSGMVPQATAFDNTAYTLPSPNIIDTVGLALGQAALGEVAPDGVIVNAVDWIRAQTLKDGSGNYLLKQPGIPGPPTIFNLPVVPTMAMKQGTFLAGAFQTVTYYERQEVEIEIATQDQSDFTSNQVKLRASERAALAVRRPQALISGALPG